MIAVLPPFVHATEERQLLCCTEVLFLRRISAGKSQKILKARSVTFHIPGQAIYGVAHRIQLAQDVCRQAVLNAYGAAAIPI